MLLYLIRHAEAVELGSPGAARDFDRALTPRGHAQSLALAAAFARLQINVDAVVASPLVRAHQTAVDLLSVWHPGARPITYDALGPEGLNRAKLSEFLAEVPGDSVAAVGHMPDIATYAEWLLGAPDGRVAFAKCAAACIAFDGDPAKAAGRLQWLVTPDWVM